MNWLDIYTTNTANYTAGVNRFPGTLRDVRALRVKWSSESEITLHEGRARLLLDALERARAAGKIGEGDYWVERGKLR